MTLLLASLFMVAQVDVPMPAGDTIVKGVEVSLLGLLLWNQIDQMLNRRKLLKLSQPIEIKSAQTVVTTDLLRDHLEGYATEDDLHAMERLLGAKIDSSFDRLDSKRSTDVASLHEKLNDAKNDLSGVKKEAEMHTQQLTAQDQKLTAILQRLPRS
jgi:hypothetical protein